MIERLKHILAFFSVVAINQIFPQLPFNKRISVGKGKKNDKYDSMIQ
jgi:hypothetical protein